MAYIYEVEDCAVDLTKVRLIAKLDKHSFTIYFDQVEDSYDVWDEDCEKVSTMYNDLIKAWSLT